MRLAHFLTLRPPKSSQIKKSCKAALQLSASCASLIITNYHNHNPHRSNHNFLLHRDGNRKTEECIKIVIILLAAANFLATTFLAAIFSGNHTTKVGTFLEEEMQTIGPL